MRSIYNASGELLTDKVVRAFYFNLHWFGNIKTSGCLVGRLTCALATTRLTPQLVGISVESQWHRCQPRTLQWFLHQNPTLASDWREYFKDRLNPVTLIPSNAHEVLQPGEEKHPCDRSLLTFQNVEG